MAEPLTKSFTFSVDYLKFLRLERDSEIEDKLKEASSFSSSLINNEIYNFNKYDSLLINKDGFLLEQTDLSTTVAKTTTATNTNTTTALSPTKKTIKTEKDKLADLTEKLQNITGKTNPTTNSAILKAGLTSTFSLYKASLAS